MASAARPSTPPLPLALQDPLLAAEWQAESSGCAAAAEKLLGALGAPAPEGKAGVSTDRLLRAAFRYVRAGGTPEQVVRLWDLTAAAAAAGGQLAADAAAMQSDLALRVAHSVAGLDPATSLPLDPVEAAAAADAAAAAAQHLAAAVRMEEDAVGGWTAVGSGKGGHRGGGSPPQALAAELAVHALAAYQAAGNMLGVLRCLAVLSHAGAAQHAALVAGLAESALQGADQLYSAAMNAPGQRPGQRGSALAAADERRALALLEQEAGVSGLSTQLRASAGATASCTQHDPRFPAIAAAFSAATAAPSSKAATAGGSGGGAAAPDGQVPLRKQTREGAAGVGGGRGMPTTTLSCDARRAREALAWWVHQLVTSALVQHLRALGSSGGGNGGAAAAEPPASLAAIKASVKAIHQALGLITHLREFHVRCRQRLPQLAPQQPAGSYLGAARRPAGGAAEPEGSLLQVLNAVEGPLLAKLAEAAFPAGGCSWTCQGPGACAAGAA